MGISSSWTITHNYKPVKVPASGALVGATYYATLKRGNDTWKFQTTNRAYQTKRRSFMKTKLIKKWYLLVLFFIWIGTMFLASTVNQEKLYQQ